MRMPFQDATKDAGIYAAVGDPGQVRIIVPATLLNGTQERHCSTPGCTDRCVQQCGNWRYAQRRI
jgi:hypothetical protein